MTYHPTSTLTRRATMAGIAAGLGVGLGGAFREVAGAEPPPETTRIRIVNDPTVPSLCWAPQYLAFELLKLEGFTEVVQVPWAKGQNESEMLDGGTIDLTAAVATDLVHAIDHGARIRVLGGLHAGCIEIFAQHRIAGITDLKGARILSTHAEGVERIFMSAMLSFIGLDPAADVEWVYEPEYSRWMSMFTEDRVDVINAFVPLSYYLHEAGFDHVLVNTTMDDPWRNYFCCMIAASDAFVRENPVAAKRALRAYVKAQQLCATGQDDVARRLVELGATDRLDHAQRALRELPYGAWRTYDPADTLRFYALRLREAGLVSGTPREIVERGSDFSFLDALRREMKT